MRNAYQSLAKTRQILLHAMRAITLNLLAHRAPGERRDTMTRRLILHGCDADATRTPEPDAVVSNLWLDIGQNSIKVTLRRACQSTIEHAVGAEKQMVHPDPTERKHTSYDSGISSSSLHRPNLPSSVN